MTKKEILSLPYDEKIKLIANDKYLDIFINDPDDVIRGALARKNYKLDILVNDGSEWVRREVARQGYALDKLMDDEDDWTREEVIIYCKNNKEKEECRNIFNLYNL